jgi:hypothetical protein
MSTYYAIQSKLNNFVIDILEASTAPGAPLDAFTQNKPASRNQMWEFVPDPQGSGYFFIKSQLNGNVIDIQHGNSTEGLKDGTLLDAYPQKMPASGTTGQTDNQLWQFVNDPAGSGYCFIMSKLNGNVIDVQGAVKSPTTPLDAYPLKAGSADNQLWKVIDGSFPATVSMVPSGPLGSNENYILYSNCNPIINAFVVIDVKEDIVCKSVGPPPGPCASGSSGGNTFGFSFQMNCYSPKGFASAWQQFAVGFWQNSAGGFTVIAGVDIWPVSGPNLINNSFPPFAYLPTSVLPAGYQITIGWGNQLNSGVWNPNVTGSFFILTDNNGNQVGRASQNFVSDLGASASDLAPIHAFELNLVGPVNGESCVLSSGSGFISYVDLQPNLSVLASEPSCTESNYITCETANSFYGPMPAGSNTSLKQSFQVNASEAPLVRAGTPRPSSQLPPSALARILGPPPKP